MGSVIDIGGPVGDMLLAIPLLLVMFGVLLALSWPSQKSAQGAVASTHGARPLEGAIDEFQDQESARISANARTAAQPSPFAERQSLAAAPAPATEATAIESPSLENTVGAAAPPASDYADPQRRAIAELIERALQDRDRDNDAQAADHLRQAIMMAAPLGEQRLHARARLELGDIAQAEGDLITACEHWQMARSLFEQERSNGEAAACENRMQRNGCPTDWVLTDF